MIFKNKSNNMKSTFDKIKIYLAMICIGTMAFLVGVPVVPKEQIDKILQADNQNMAAEVIEAADEQS